MKTSTAFQKIELKNPIDEVEEVVCAQNLPYLRFGADEIMINYPDSWENFQSFWTWDRDFYSLDVSASSLFKFKDSQKPLVYELISLINDQLWVGHFDLTDETTPTFRHTLLLRGLLGSTSSIVEDLFAIVLAEYQRFFPAFEYVIKGNKKPQEALSLALIDTQGEA